MKFVFTKMTSIVGDSKDVLLMAEKIDELQPCSVNSMKPLVVRWVSFLKSKFQLLTDSSLQIPTVDALQVLLPV